MVHPSFDILTEFLKTGKPVSVADHLKDCEQCSTIVEGIGIAKEASEKQGISFDQLLTDSKDKTLTSIYQDKGSTNKSVHLYSSWLKLAAASVILVIGAVFYFNSVRFDANDFVVQQITTDRPTPNTERNAISVSAKEWTQFVAKYNESNYKDALSSLSKIKKEDLNSRIEFFTGLCHLYGEPVRYDSAVSYLSSVVRVENRFKEQATWYLALCYYQSNELDLAKRLLLDISNVEDHFKQKEAKQLLGLIR